MDFSNIPGVVYCEFEKGEYIIQQGEEVNFIYQLKSGTCYRTTITEKGDEIIYGVRKSKEDIISGPLVGVLALFADGNSVNSFIARSKCSCYKIPKELFLKHIEDKPNIIKKLLHLAMWEYRQLYNSFQLRQEGKIANLLCEFLLKNAQVKNGKLLIEDYSYADISRFLGIHKVTVSKIMKVLRNENIICKETSKGIQIIDKEKLTRYTETDILEYK